MVQTNSMAASAMDLTSGVEAKTKLYVLSRYLGHGYSLNFDWLSNLVVEGKKDDTKLIACFFYGYKLIWVHALFAYSSN